MGDCSAASSKSHCAPRTVVVTYLPSLFLRTMWDKTKGRFVPHGIPHHLNARDVAELIESKINKIFVM